MKEIELAVWTQAEGAALLLKPPKKKVRSISIECALDDQQARELISRCASPRLEFLSMHGVALRDGKAWKKTLSQFSALTDFTAADAFGDGASALEWLAQVRLRRLISFGITSVELASVAAEFSKHVLKPIASTLTELGIYASALDGHHASALLNGLRLELIGLGDNPLGLDGIRHLISSTDVSALSEIALPACQLGDEGIKLVTFWLASRRLDHVFISRNGITARGASEIGHRWRANLRGSLLLADNPLRADGITALGPAMRSVRWIDLAATDLDAEAVKRLSAMEMPRLHELQIDENELGDSGALPMRWAPWLPRLRALSINDNDLGARSIRPIVHAASKTCAIRLEDGNRVSERTLKTLRKRNKGLL